MCVLGPALPFTGRLEQRTWSNKKKIVKITGPMTICIDSFINCNELFPFLIYREVNLTHLVRYSFLYKTHFESFKLILTLLTYYWIIETNKCYLFVDINLEYWINHYFWNLLVIVNINNDNVTVLLPESCTWAKGRIDDSLSFNHLKKKMIKNKNEIERKLVDRTVSNLWNIPPPP